MNSSTSNCKSLIAYFILLADLILNLPMLFILMRTNMFFVDWKFHVLIIVVPPRRNRRLFWLLPRWLPCRNRRRQSCVPLTNDHFKTLSHPVWFFERAKKKIQFPKQRELYKKGWRENAWFLCVGKSLLWDGVTSAMRGKDATKILHHQKVLMVWLLKSNVA